MHAQANRRLLRLENWSRKAIWVHLGAGHREIPYCISSIANETVNTYRWQSRAMLLYF